MSTPRSFQKRFQSTLEARLLSLAQIESTGRSPTHLEKTIVCNIAPGSGKTLMALLGLNLAWQKGEIDTATIFVPRTNLARQGELSWKEHRKKNPNNSLMGKMLHANNDPPLLRAPDQFGCLLTYSSLAAAPVLHFQFSKEHARQIALVLDEAQILGFDSDSDSGTKAAEYVLQLADHAKIIILMTGTPYRGDGQKLILSRYSDPDEHGHIYLQADVEATYLDGVRESYLRPLEASLYGANVELQDLLTGKQEESSLDELERGLGDVLRHEKFYSDLVNRAVEKVTELQQQWSSYRGLIGAVDQKHARKIQQYMKRYHPQIKTLLAISDDADAQRNLDLFQAGGYDFLITVGMAFVGYDVPEISVVCCLTNVRDSSWLRQFFARGMRWADLNSPELTESQRVYIIAPDDPKMHKIIEDLRTESALGLKQKQQDQLSAATMPLPAPKSTLVVCDVEVTDGTVLGIDPETDVNPEEFEHLDDLRRRHKLGSSLTAIKGLINEVSGKTVNGSSQNVSHNEQRQPAKTEKELEEELRREIKKIHIRADAAVGDPKAIDWTYTYRAIKAHLGHEMKNLNDLEQALDWLRSTWLPQCLKQAANKGRKASDAQ